MAKCYPYFEEPTQVMFLESEEVNDDPCWLGGIAFEDRIICMCCGAVVMIENLQDLRKLEWIDLSGEVIGMDMDVTLEETEPMIKEANE